MPPVLPRMPAPQEPIQPASPIESGQVRIVTAGDIDTGADGTQSVSDLRTTMLPALAISGERFTAGTIGFTPRGPVAVLVTDATARKLGLIPATTMMLFHSPEEITLEQERQIEDAWRGQGYTYVERGYTRDDATLLTIVFAVIGLLILIATSVATAMSTAELAPSNATLAAVGATRHTRRAIAASQALFVALVGTALGLLVGLVPGISLTPSLTIREFGYTSNGATMLPTFNPVIVVPWLPLLAAAILIPVLAATMAWFAIRRAPVLTRRTT